MTDPDPRTDDHDERRLDGNAAGGALRTIFAMDVTGAIRTCGGCGTAAPLGEHPAFLDAPGTVLRCPGCGDVALRIVTAPGRVYLELAGTRLLELPA